MTCLPSSLRRLCGRFRAESVYPMDDRTQAPLRRRLLDLLLAVWGVIVIVRFSTPYLGIPAPAMAIESSRVHIAVLGVCLALAAIDAALDAVRVADRKV
jgi:hypothetical protein